MRAVNLRSALVLTLLLAPLSHADVNKGMIYNLEWAQRKKVSSCADCIDATPLSETQKADVADLCMSQICGTADQVKTADELAVELIRDPDFIGSLGLKAVEALNVIHSVVDEGTKEKLLTLEGYRDLKKKGDLAPTPAFQRLHDFTFVTLAIGSAKFKQGPNRQIPVVVDKEATMKNMSDLSPAQQRWATDAADRLLRSPVGSDLILSGSEAPRDYLRIKYPKLSMTEALRIEAQQAQKQTAELAHGRFAQIGQMMTGVEDMLTNPVIGKALNGEDLTETEVAKVLEIRTSVAIITDVLTPKEEGGQTVVPEDSSKETVAEFFRRMKLDEQLTKYEADLKNAPRVKELRQAAYESCRTNYIFQMATLPTEAQLKVSQQNGAWAKNKIKDILGPVLSAQSKKMLNQEIENTYFALPRSRETFHDYFIARAKAELTGTISSTREHQALLASGKHQPLTLLNLHMNLGDLTIDRHFQETEEFCEEFEVRMTSDDSLTSTGRIRTSWVSVRQPEVGKAIMLHELGHNAFGHLDSEKTSTASRGKFQEIRRCLASNHPEAPGGSFAEEDWSDLIAAKGTLETSANVGCTLNVQEENQYMDLKLSLPDGDHAHSSDLYRAIQMHKVQKGKLPSGCEQLLESEGNAMKFNSCF